MCIQVVIIDKKNGCQWDGSVNRNKTKQKQKPKQNKQPNKTKSQTKQKQQNNKTKTNIFVYFMQIMMVIGENNIVGDQFTISRRRSISHMKDITFYHEMVFMDILVPELETILVTFNKYFPDCI